ncbi:hypothetical protein E2C01_069326 [Portunus trituberculatus]|uniref:Uncharacterized protein n=1 Tax=Portunus trituberculatus TaxID=210409 RepID=A0A5B7HY87_PORTR|nr:hypothetical protein [Portunus trituberculatus]
MTVLFERSRGRGDIGDSGLGGAVLHILLIRTTTTATTITTIIHYTNHSTNRCHTISFYFPATHPMKKESKHAEASPHSLDFLTAPCH